MVRDHGLEIVGYQPFRDFEGMPEPQRSRGFERARRKFELMCELGAARVLVCSNVSPLSLGGIDRAAEDLSELGRLVAPARPAEAPVTGEQLDERSPATGLDDGIQLVRLAAVLPLAGSDEVDLFPAGRLGAGVLAPDAEQHRLCDVAEVEPDAATVRPAALRALNQTSIVLYSKPQARMTATLPEAGRWAPKDRGGPVR
jgi:hypothetical protein